MSIDYLYVSDKCNRAIAEHKLAGRSVTPEVYFETNLIVLNGKKFTLISTEQGMIEESNYLNKKGKKGRWIDAFTGVTSVECLKKPTIVIGNPGYENYYHWVYQIWMALLWVRAKYPKVVSYDVLGPKLNGWRSQYIEMLNIDNYIEASSSSSYVLESAVFSNVCWGRFAFRASGDVLACLPNVALLSAPKRIYISRKDTPKRRVLNEEALELLLKKYGFETVVLSELNVVEQMSIFKCATHIIGAHGAGLTNIIYSEPSTVLFELFGEDYVNPCFYAIASEKGMTYRCFVNPVKNEGNKNYHNSHLLVDVELLESVLKKASLEKL